MLFPSHHQVPLSLLLHTLAARAKGLPPAAMYRAANPLWGPPATGLKQRCLMRVLGRVLSPWCPFSSIFLLVPYTHGKAISTSDSMEIHVNHAGFVPVLSFCNSEQKHKRKQHVMKY